MLYSPARLLIPRIFALHVHLLFVQNAQFGPLRQITVVRDGAFGPSGTVRTDPLQCMLSSIFACCPTPCQVHGLASTVFCRCCGCVRRVRTWWRSGTASPRWTPPRPWSVRWALPERPSGPKSSLDHPCVPFIFTLSTLMQRQQTIHNSFFISLLESKMRYTGAVTQWHTWQNT